MILTAMADAMAHLCYLHGYKQRLAPKFARRMLAQTELHRAWLSGKNGYFHEDDVRYGLCHPYGLLSLADASDVDHTEEEWDRLNAAYDLDHEMHIEEALKATVDGLAASPLAGCVLREFVDLVKHDFDESDAAECLRFLLAEGAAMTWEIHLLRIALPTRNVSFGPDRPSRVVASAVAYWEDLRQ